MQIADYIDIVFAVCVLHAVVTGVYLVGIRRDAGWQPGPRVMTLVRRTLIASAGLLTLYLLSALLSFALLPVAWGFPLFVAAWVVYGLSLGGLLWFSAARAHRLRNEMVGKPAS